MKKTWKRPQLLVLNRGKAQESVLVTCKAGSSHLQPGYEFGCNWGNPALDCNTQADS